MPDFGGAIIKADLFLLLYPRFVWIAFFDPCSYAEQASLELVSVHFGLWFRTLAL